MRRSVSFFGFVAVALIILGGLLLPGYILSLDMIFPPSIPLPTVTGGAFGNALPIRWVLYGLGLFMPGWVVQKIALLGLFTLIPLIAYRHLLPKETPTAARVFAALLYTINPFVYTRLLAGHWMHLYAYALLPWIVSLCLRQTKKEKSPLPPKLRLTERRRAKGGAGGGSSVTGGAGGGPSAKDDGWVLGFALALTFAFSLHIGIMALLIAVIGWIVRALEKQPCAPSEQQLHVQTIKQSEEKQFNNLTIQQSGETRLRSVRTALIAILSFAVLTSYWTIPYLANRSHSILTEFTGIHEQAFMTADDVRMGTIPNVLVLYGFWGEREPWAQQFIWVKDSSWIFYPAGFILCGIILYGIVRTMKSRETRRRGIAMVLIALVALVFSCGLAETPFKLVNAWFFDRIGFWRGFRDTQKWSALLALAYAYFGGMGLIKLQTPNSKFQINSKLQIPNSKFFLPTLVFLAVAFYSYPMLFGFWGQLRPVWYPDAWKRANAIIEKDPQCKAVFLPWHAYITYGFTNNILVANPANYFHCTMVASRQVELGEVGAQSVSDAAYDTIDGVVTGRDSKTPEQAIDVFRREGIRYILRAHDVPSDDPWDYSFLNADGIKKEELGEMTVYRLP